MGLVYVYSDEGVSAFSLRQTVLSVKKYLPFLPVKTIKAEAVRKGNWIDQCSLFIMPGGRDIPYHRNLFGVGNQHIKKFVQQGGSYLGICAGGYYGASFISFDQGNDLEIKEERELKFFSGSAIGPLFDPKKFCYDSEKGAYPASVEYLGKRFCVYYNGGCFFKKDKDDNSKTLCYYVHNGFPAIIYNRIGLGKVVLSGVHFEYLPSFLERRDLSLEIVETLKKDDPLRQSLAYDVFNLLIDS